jgi:hypothetical protein
MYCSGITEQVVLKNSFIMSTHKVFKGGVMRKFIFTTAFFLAIGLIVSMGSARAADPVLESSDCIKCHPKVVHENMDDGGKHKTEVGCVDCHNNGHPPTTPVENMIPQCSMCHEGEPHFEVDNCLGCHQNPHQPLHIAFGDDNVAVCNTCHPAQVSEVKDNPSAHGGFDCAVCHHDKHGYIPDCMECHEPHRKGQVFADCVSCHKVHQPLNVAYGEAVPNQDCGACHGDLATLLASGSTKHAALQCVFCHKDKHGYLPACQDCHGVPHPKSMMSKFPKCLDCHNDPHDLSI